MAATLSEARRKPDADQGTEAGAGVGPGSAPPLQIGQPGAETVR